MKRAPGNEGVETSGPVTEPVTGPFQYTFTCRLPFVLGIADGLDHEVALPADYANEKDAEVFQRRPFVRMRIFNAPVADRKFWPVNMSVAVEHFYRGDIGAPDEDGKPLYEQWISLETPAAFLVGERPTDPAYAFHRSLGVLNLFLQAFALARGDDHVRPVSAAGIEADRHNRVPGPRRPLGVPQLDVDAPRCEAPAPSVEARGGSP